MEDSNTSNESVVSKLSQYDINFKYQQIKSKEDFIIPTVSCLVKISEFNECEVGTGSFFSVKTKLTFGNVPVKMAQTRYGKDVKVKEDCVLENESGNISFHIWDDIFKGFKKHTSYYFKNVQLMKFKGNARFIFLYNPQKSLVNVCLMKILKSTVTKKVIVCFYDLGEENF